MTVCGWRHASASLHRGTTRYPLRMGPGGHQGRSRRVRNISPPPGFDPRTVQSFAIRYTDYAIPAHIFEERLSKITKIASRIIFNLADILTHKNKSISYIIYHSYEINFHTGLKTGVYSKHKLCEKRVCSLQYLA
jgi:hypothetical protein